MSDAGWKGRTEFDDLFAADASPPPIRGGVDAKLEHVRAKLKRMETTVARAKHAWKVREREMDRLETLLDHERDRADAASDQATKLSRRLHELQQYMVRKKGEFDEFSAQLRASFAQRNQHEQRLRRDLEGAKAEYDELAEASDEEIEVLRSRVERLRGELDETVREREAREGEAEQRIRELQGWVNEMERDLAKSQQKARRHRGELNKELVNKERQLRKMEERTDRYQRRVGRRDKTIEKLEARLEQRVPEWTIYAFVLAGMALVLLLGLVIATPSPDQTVEAMCLVARPESHDLVPTWVTITEFVLVVIAVLAGGAGLTWAIWTRRAEQGHRYR